MHWRTVACLLFAFTVASAVTKELGLKQKKDTPEWRAVVKKDLGADAAELNEKEVKPKLDSKTESSSDREALSAILTSPIEKLDTQGNSDTETVEAEISDIEKNIEQDLQEKAENELTKKCEHVAEITKLESPPLASKKLRPTLRFHGGGGKPTIQVVVPTQHPHYTAHHPPPAIHHYHYEHDGHYGHGDYGYGGYNGYGYGGYGYPGYAAGYSGYPAYGGYPGYGFAGYPGFGYPYVFALPNATLSPFAPFVG